MSNLLDQHEPRKKPKSDSASSTSRISASSLKRIMNNLQGQKHRSSTKTTYLTAWRKFNQFLVRLDYLPPKWENRVSLYVAYLIDCNTKSSTIRSYLSGIRSILQDDGYVLNKNKILLSSLTRACRLTRDRVKARFPIQKALMEMILFEIEAMYLQTKAPQVYLAKMYKCMTILGYYGLLHIGEMAEGVHSIKARNIHEEIKKKKILLILFTSKTHGLDSNPQKVRITGDSGGIRAARFSPFDVTCEFLKSRGGYTDEHENLFVFRDGSNVRPCHYRNVLRRALKRIGLNHKLYDTHSLRIGRASDLLKYGFTIYEIKLLGRWKSNAVFKYIRN